MKYHPRSERRLTTAEEEWLTTYLRAKWQEAMGWPVLVTNRYEFHGTSVAGVSGYTLVLGIHRLYETLGDEALQNATEREPRLKGLYYPGATPSNALLFESSLYFDETYLLHPGSTLLEDDRHPYGERDPEAADRYRRQLAAFTEGLSEFDDQVLPLKRAGVLYACPPKMQEHPAFIDLITGDLNDKEFCRIAEEETLGPAFVAARKMEPLLPLVGDGDSIEEIRQDLHESARYDHFFNDDKKPELFRPRYYGIKQVAPALGASILLNHAHLLAEQYQCLPITDNPVAARLLQCKLARIQNTKAFHDYRRELQLKSAPLAIRVLKEYLPRFRFESFEQVLEARERLKTPLVRFRDAMRTFAAEIDETPYDANLMRRIEDTVASKIKPAVESLEKELQTSRDDFVSKCLRNLRAGTVPLLASIFVGLPTSAVIAIGAGVMTFEAAIETLREIRRTRNNGLSVLLG
jgi:hypothetical protein